MKPKRYPGVRGKVVQYVESVVADNGEIILGIRFTDATYLSFVIGSQVTINRTQLLKLTHGNETVLKTYKPYEKELAREERTGKPRGF